MTRFKRTKTNLGRKTAREIKPGDIIVIGQERWTVSLSEDGGDGWWRILAKHALGVELDYRQLPEGYVCLA